MQKSKSSLVLATLAIVMVTGAAFGYEHAPAPDAGSSALLLSLAFGGLAVVRRFMR